MKKTVNNFQKELDKLKIKDTHERRAVFLRYCKKKIDLEKNNKLNVEEVSNQICGVCSLYFKEIMPEFEEVMNIACDLELPKSIRDRPMKDWDRLKELLNLEWL